MPAILFGSISTIADTSELQRQAFNQAFEAHGLEWRWSQDDYRALLQKSGGQDRVAEYAAARGQSVDAEAVHHSKSEFFHRILADAGATVRPGVVDTIQQAKDQGYRVGLVTTTSPENVESLLAAVATDVSRSDFDVVVDASSVQEPKPDRASYAFALSSVGEQADACVAIEDNLGGVEAAVAAGLTCVAFPNENTAGHDFATDQPPVERLDFAHLRSQIPNA